MKLAENKFILRQYFLILLISLLKPTLLLASNWEIKPSWILSSEAKKQLKNRHNSVNTPKELQSLLIEIGRLRPMLNLEASYSKGYYTINASLASIIGDIEVNSTTNMIETEIRGRLQRFIGQVSAKEIIKSVLSDTRSILVERGYQNATINIKQASTKKWNQLILNISEDYPCRIRHIGFGFQLPKNIEFDLGIGDICDKYKIREAIDDLEENLAEEGYYQKRILKYKLKYDQKSNSADLYIPGTLGQRITYTIKTPIKDIFDSSLTEIDSSIIDPEAMISEIESNYRQAGYDDVQVDSPKKIIRKNNNVHYEFNIKPGPEYFISSIEFQGNHHFSTDLIIENLGFDGIRSSPLNQEKIRSGIEIVKGNYQNDGYWDAKIKFPRIAKNRETGAAKLVFTINEGKQRIFTDIIVKGNHNIETGEVRSYFKGVSGRPLSWSMLIDFEKRLTAIYRSRGYLYSEFKLSLVQNRSYRVIRTSILLDIEEGKRVKFGDITISGLVKTSDQIVRRELRFQQGDWFDPDAVDRTKRALVKLGIFASISIAATDSSSIIERLEYIPYTINLREAKPGNIAFGPGWSYEDGARYLVEASYSNIGGTGRKLFMKSKISEERQQERISNKSLIGRKITLGYLEPYILQMPINVTLSANHQALADKGRWELSNSGEVSIGHEFRGWLDRSKISLFYGLKHTKIETNELEGNIFRDTGDTRIGDIGIRMEIDQRDSLLWTTSGYKITSKLAIARFGFGGDTEYLRWDLAGSQFFELHRNWVIALGVSLTQYSNIKSKARSKNILPTSERLDAGGAESNRGFKKGTLGPIFKYNTKDEIGNWSSNTSEAGGSSRGIYKIELRHQISNDFGVAAFIDSSNVFMNKDQEKIFTDGFNNDFQNNPSPPPTPDTIEENAFYNFEHVPINPTLIREKNYVSYGIALNYLTFLGSFDLSYGIPWRRCLPGLTDCYKRGQEGSSKMLSGVFHISIGANF